MPPIENWPNWHCSLAPGIVPRFLRVTVGTTACESLNAASNIFLGQAMAPLLIQPYLGGGYSSAQLCGGQERGTHLFPLE